MNEQEEINFNDWKDSGILSLTTYYKSGKSVATPLGYNKKGNKIFVNTRSKSFKIKRIKNNPTGKIAQSNYKGTIKSSFIDVNIKILNSTAEGEARKVMKYDSKLSWKFMRFREKLMFWKKPEERTFLEITKK